MGKPPPFFSQREGRVKNRGFGGVFFFPFARGRVFFFFFFFSNPAFPPGGDLAQVFPFFFWGLGKTPPKNPNTNPPRVGAPGFGGGGDPKWGNREAKKGGYFRILVGPPPPGFFWPKKVFFFSNPPGLKKNFFFFLGGKKKGGPGDQEIRKGETLGRV